MGREKENTYRTAFDPGTLRRNRMRPSGERSRKMVPFSSSERHSTTDAH
jgi:hypothetical protein